MMYILDLKNPNQAKKQNPKVPESPVERKRETMNKIPRVDAKQARKGIHLLEVIRWGRPFGAPRVLRDSDLGLRVESFKM